MVKTVQSFCLQLCSGVTTIQRKMVIEADWCPVSGICTQTTMGLAKKLLFCNFMPRSFKDILSFSNFEVLRAVWIKMRILGKDSNQRGNSQVGRVKGWSTTVGFCQVCHLLFSLSLWSDSWRRQWYAKKTGLTRAGHHSVVWTENWRQVLQSRKKELGEGE